MTNILDWAKDDFLLQQKLKVTYKPLEELDARVASNAGDISAAITRELFSGRAHFKKVANGFYPDWNPKGIEAAI